MIALDSVSIKAGSFSLQNVSFHIPAGAWCVFMGSTGSGKSTILETICGLRKPSAGRVLVGGKEVTTLHPSVRGIGYVPQDRALFRTMTVGENIGFALRLRGWGREQIARRVNELAGWLHISSLVDRYPDGLSGGEAQRVALGRALAPSPVVLCLDEPLSALDDETRDEMRALLQSVRQHTSVTALHVTHQRADAAGLADQILRLKDGRVAAEPL